MISFPSRGTLAVVVVSALLVGIRAFDPPTNPLDEFLPLVAAQRVLAGEVPYRDFTSLYPPLMTLVDVGLLAVGPASLLLSRLAFVAIVVAGLVLVKAIAARLAASETVGTFIGLLAACAHGAPPWGYSLVLATVLILGSLTCALNEGRRWTIAAGALLGLAALARHDAAAYATLPIGLVMWSRSRRTFALFLGIAGVFPLTVALLLVILEAAQPAFDQLFVIPATLYPAIRRLSWPLPWRGPGDAELSPALGSIYGPFIVSGLALARTWTTTRRRDHLACAALPFALGFTALVRPDHAHVYAASLASFAAIGILARASWRSIGLALALTVPVAGIAVTESVRISRHVLSPKAVFATRSGRRGLLDHGGVDNQRARALDWIASEPAGSRIFVALPRHDRIWINDVSFYFDAHALPATRHHELYPLVATTLEVQEEIVRDLDDWRPRFVVISRVPIAHEPNASAVTFGVSVLDDYISRAYRLDLDTGRYQVLRRIE